MPALAEDADEGVLVRALPPLPDLVQLPGVQRRQRRVHSHRALGARDLQVRQEQTLLVAGGPLGDVVLDIAAELGTVGVPNDLKPRGGAGADDLGGSAEVSEGLLQGGGVVGHQVQWRLGFRVEEKKAKFVRRDG
jgi:hypothetical protein